MRLYHGGMLRSLKRAARSAAREEGLSIRRTWEPLLVRGMTASVLIVIVLSLTLALFQLTPTRMMENTFVWVLLVHGASICLAGLIDQSWRESRQGVLAALPIRNQELFSRILGKLGRWEVLALGAAAGGGWAALQGTVRSFESVAWGAALGALALTVVWSLAALLLALRWLRWANVLIPLSVTFLYHVTYKHEINRYGELIVVLFRCHPADWTPVSFYGLACGGPYPEMMLNVAVQLALFALSFPLMALARRRCEEVDLAAQDHRASGVTTCTQPPPVESVQLDGEEAVRKQLCPAEVDQKPPWLWLEKGPWSRLGRRDRALVELTSWRYEQVSLWGLLVFLSPLLLAVFLHPSVAPSIAREAALVCGIVGAWIGWIAGPRLGELMVCHPLDLRACARLRAGLLTPRRLGILGVTWGVCTAISLIGGRFDPLYDILGMGLFAAGSWEAGRRLHLVHGRLGTNVRFRAQVLSLAEVGLLLAGVFGLMGIADRAIAPAMVPLLGALYVVAPRALGWLQERLVFRWADWQTSKAA